MDTFKQMMAFVLLGTVIYLLTLVPVAYVVPTMAFFIGLWAACWNVFGDDSRPDPFHLATQAILDGPFSPSAGERGIPFGLDAEARLGALKRTGAFDIADTRTSTWPLVLNADQTMALYATYSNINVRPDREAVLAELGRIARDMFDGRVVRNMTTSLYLARRAA